MSPILFYLSICIGAVGLSGLLFWVVRTHIQKQKELARIAQRESARAAARRRKQERINSKPSPMVPSQASEVPSKVPRGRASSVLLVDDSPTTLRALRKILEAWNYRVTTAADGRQALGEMQRFKPDLVISDIDMPEMTGLELVQLMRSDLVLVDVPVILITGSTALHLQAAKQAGINGLLAKPFDEKTLIDQVRYILQE